LIGGIIEATIPIGGAMTENGLAKGFAQGNIVNEEKLQ
jgi:hypothetical protein